MCALHGHSVAIPYSDAISPAVLNNTAVDVAGDLCGYAELLSLLRKNSLWGPSQSILFKMDVG